MDEFEFKDEDLDEDLGDEQDTISFDTPTEEETPQDETFGNELENKAEDNTANKKFSLIVIITVSVVVGLLVFFIVYLIFNPKEKPKEVNTNLDIKSSQVQELYSRVTYGMNGIRYDKFIKEPNVTIKDFSNYDKFYYALSFIQNNDFFNTGTNGDNQLEKYTLNMEKISGYMNKFFGDDITYDKKVNIYYTFLEVDKKGNNSGFLTYDESLNKYSIYFNKKNPRQELKPIAKKYFSELTKATQVNENEIELVENIIYTQCTENKSKTYTCGLYKDYEKTVKIGEKQGVSADTQLDFNEFEKHSKIIYRFKKSSEGTYVFKSSKIKYSE